MGDINKVENHRENLEKKLNFEEKNNGK